MTLCPCGIVLGLTFGLSMLIGCSKLCIGGKEPPLLARGRENPTSGTQQATPVPLTIVQPQQIDLDGRWRFQVDPTNEGGEAGWAEADFDDKGWVEVVVPHTWGTMPQYADYEGVAWYRRSFTVPAEWQGAHLRLQFDAVFYLSQVWLNGRYLGQHEGGYTPFFFDIADGVRYGDENTVAVRVDNKRATDRIPAILRPGWSFDWWNYGGIVRNVHLSATSKVFIDRQRIVAEPELVDSATITATTTISNTSPFDRRVHLKAAIHDETTGSPVWTGKDDPGLEATITIPAQASREVVLKTTLPSPRLWHFDHPNLYQLVTEIRGEAGDPLHHTEETFGIRKIEIKDAHLHLNGERVRLVGLTRHEDSPEHGLAETVSVMAADFDDLKRLNTVLSRPVHYPQHEFILDYCDHSGILLIPEVPAWQLTRTQMGREEMRELEKQQLREMIEASFNHPSVWAWSLGNEIESKTAEGHAFVKEMVAYIRSLDPTRYVAFASNRLHDDPGLDATAFTDFVMMNQYFGTWVGPKEGLGPALDRIHETWPDKLVIISEYGFEPRWNRLWGPPTSSLDHDRYYYVTDEELDDPMAADRERQKLIREQLAIMRERDFVGGAIFWCYQDYRTPSGFEMGVVDAQRQHLRAYNVLQEEYSPALFEAVTHNVVEFQPGQEVTTEVAIKSRGPIEAEIPAYTLEGYTLHWELLDDKLLLTGGDLEIPTLHPGEGWRGSLTWTVPEEQPFTLRLQIARPTGFLCLQHEESFGQ
ncbi:MAG: glycoside hydrolase family 2 TIM barrel-domain containing protein [Anaerolineae bacterium]